MVSLQPLGIGPVVTATQGTNISTGVTCSGKHGQITTQAMDAAAAAENAFTVTNTAVQASSLVFAQITSTASAGTPLAYVSSVAAGSFVITITNLHDTNALDAAAVISFVVL